MRWGITDEATNQNKTTEICLNEIRKCFNESIGPSFVVRRMKKKNWQQLMHLNIYELINIRRFSVIVTVPDF